MKEIFEAFRVKRIIHKYDDDFSIFFTRANSNEIKIVLQYTAKKANAKQQLLAAQADTVAA